MSKHRTLSLFAASTLVMLSARTQPTQSSCTPLPYCPSQATSTGCFPRIDAEGCSSASATSGFEVECRRLIPGTLAVMLYDVTGKASAKFFQGGVLCVSQPIFRTPAQFVGGFTQPPCEGRAAIDMNAFAAGELGGLPLPALQTPGTVVACQWFTTDPGSPFNSNLSNALRYVVGP
jgi:hypothetical protein